MSRLVSEHFKGNGSPKKAFESRKAAEQERKRSRKASAYKCKFCKQWHVGGKGGDELKQVAKRSVTKK